MSFPRRSFRAIPERRGKRVGKTSASSSQKTRFVVKSERMINDFVYLDAAFECEKEKPMGKEQHIQAHSGSHVSLPLAPNPKTPLTKRWLHPSGCSRCEGFQPCKWCDQPWATRHRVVMFDMPRLLILSASTLLNKYASISKQQKDHRACTWLTSQKGQCEDGRRKRHLCRATPPHLGDSNSLAGMPATAAAAAVGTARCRPKSSQTAGLGQEHRRI